ncbi:MAG: Amuc_1099 family pilus-like system protein [Rubritalea sp.]|uniref:Amuc_1099 family pilus-like system protein n=1 Tax=Rubritalea sp. TaxID=2109375 RepID=UPI0032426ECD
MSWLKENYEKAALGGAAAILVGVVVTSFLVEGMKTSDQALPAEINNKSATELLAEMAVVLEVRKNPAGIRPKLVDGREVDLFVGQTLYMADGSVDPIDIYEGTPVHKGIPNEWWRKYGIDPSFANAAERDADKDGFTNREEFDSQTHPADRESYPSPLAKVVGNGVDIFKMQMKWSSFDQNSITISYRDNKLLSFRERVKQGAAFFQDGNAEIKGRFVLSAEAIKVVDPVTGRSQDAYTVEDSTPRYRGTPKQNFTLLRKGKVAGYNEVQDRSVTLTLHALGQEGSSFVVKEFEKFSLPYDPKAEDRPYQVTKIEPFVGQNEVFSVEIAADHNGKPESKTLTVRKR